ncbi:MAG: IS66 family transposase, partial [Alphaproteobacteria bacterium]|nr:IS66 family transposase [Alphaproteobacteria bacterium]
MKLSMERERAQFEQNGLLSAQIVQLNQQLNLLTIQTGELTQTIASLQEALLQKNKDVSSLSGKNRGLAKLLNNSSEKQTPEETEVPPDNVQEKKPFSAKERGNNGAKRKIHINLEEEIVDIWPQDPEFDREKASELKVVESIRYAYLPSRVIKKIIRQHNCVFNNKLYTVSAPRTPLMNSNYEASFIAGLLQFKYTYSMPVERIVKLFNENGFELEKATAHSLISKTAALLECFDDVLRKAIHTDPYIRMDETYHQ